MRWPALATEGTHTYTADWTQKISTGITLTDVCYEADPSGGLTFANGIIDTNKSSVDITANNDERQYNIKCTPVLSSGAISPVSIEIKVVKHKPAR